MSVRSLWSEKTAAGLVGPALCAYASRLIGADPRLVLWGGGNSSVKTLERRGGREERVLWVKASGFDMKTITEEGFTPLRLDGLDALRSFSSMTDDEMVAAQAEAALDGAAARPSIETLLHAWVPAPHVYHTHADDVAGFTCAPKSRERARRAFGDGVLWVPYRRPGFELSTLVARAVEDSPKAWGLILDKHGALTWGKTAREAYEAMLRLAKAAGRNVRLPGDKAELSGRPARLAGAAASRRVEVERILGWFHEEGIKVVRFCDAPEVLRFLARPEAQGLSQRGTFTMEHALHVKARPLFWRPGPRSAFSAAMEGYRRWYGRYFDAHAPKGTPALDANPRVVLVPGVGLFALGQDARSALIAEDIYLHTIEVISRVASFTRYAPLDLERLAEVEFWPLELRKRAVLLREAVAA